MTTMSFDQAHSFAAGRSPALSLGARLAALQVRQVQAPHLTGLLVVAVRLALAAVPFTGLIVMFVTL